MDFNGERGKGKFKGGKKRDNRKRKKTAIEDKELATGKNNRMLRGRRKGRAAKRKHSGEETLILTRRRQLTPREVGELGASSSSSPHQAVQLGDGALAARLADVPDLDAALAAGVDVARGVADGDGAHHLAVAQRVDLPRVPRDARPRQRVVRERHRLHLPVRAHVERVRPARGGRGVRELLGTAQSQPCPSALGALSLSFHVFQIRCCPGVRL